MPFLKNGHRNIKVSEMSKNSDIQDEKSISKETPSLPLTALVLCGGKSERMGRPKAFLPYQGTTMVGYILSTVRNLFTEVFLVTNEPELYEDLGVDVVKDILPHRGPLGAILSGLLVANNQHSFVFACDMPFIDKKLVRKMCGSRENNDVLVLAHQNGIEPLIGIYSKNCIKPLEESLFAGDSSLQEFVSTLNAKAFFYEEFSRVQGTEVIPPYFNIDTPQDYSRALTRSVYDIRQFLNKSY